MRKRKRFWNKAAVIVMIFLMIMTVFIQPVSAEGSNLPAEGSESVVNEGSNLPAQGSEPVGDEGKIPSAKGSESGGNEGSNPLKEGSKPAIEEESKPPVKNSETTGDEGSNPPKESSKPAIEEESKPPKEGSKPAIEEESKPSVESLELLNEVSPNALGELTKEGKPLSGVTFSIYNHTDKIWYDSVTDKSGKFGFTLPDGEYLLQGIWLDSEQKWYPLEVSFTVQNDVVVNPEILSLKLTEKTPNVTGSILKDEQPVARAIMNARTATGEEKWYDAKTDDNGNYQLNMPDGDYQIIGVWVESEPKWYPLEVSFTVENGEAINPSTLNLDLTENSPNVKGTVNKDGKPVTGALMNARTATGEEKWYDAKTDDNGNYQLHLPDGEYQVIGVWVESESKWYPLEISFSVQKGEVENPEKINLDLTEKGPNVNGSINKNDRPVSGALINARTATGIEKWYDAKTDDNGNYQLYLPDGEYQIIGVWVESESKWYPLEVSFTVQKGEVENPEKINLDLTEKGPNVNGSINKNDKPVSGALINARTATGIEKWYDAKTDDNGNYQLYLPNGEYQIIGVWVESESKWYPLEVFVTVQNGEVVNPEVLNLDLTEKGPNVKGSVIKGGKPVTGALMNARTTTGAEKWYDAKTDVNGNYQLNMPDGEYQIIGVWVESESKWYPLNVTFSITDGVLQGQYELVLDLSQKLNVSGSIQDEKGKVANVDMTMKNVDTGEYFYSSSNENGEFTLQLVDGNYKIELAVVDGQFYKPIYLDKEFSILNGKLLVAGAETESLDVTLPALSLNVQLEKNGEPLKNIEVAIVQPNEVADRYFYKDVDENGVASFRMNDGEYRVAGYYDYNEDKSYYLSDAITVSNGTTNPNPFIIDVTDLGLTTVEGSLSDSNGTVGNSIVTFYNKTINDIFSIKVNSSGSFSQELPDGDYTIESIYSDAFDYVYDVKANTDHDRFTISEGKITINGNEMDRLDLSIPTVSLKVQILENENPVQGNLFIYNSTHSWYAQTNENGELNLRVPNGDFTIDSFDDGINTYQINRMATANNSKPVSWIIDLADLNNEKGIVNGTVMDGNTPVANGQFTIENTNDYWGYYDVVTNENGQFSADLVDGDYVISKVFDAGGNPIASIDYFFSVQNGEMVVNQKVVKKLMIELPPESLHVQILNNDTPLNGEVEISKMVNGYELRYLVTTNEKGEFSLRIPDGVYTILALYEMDEPYDWYLINTEVNVLNGTTNPNPIVIDIGSETGYKGKVQDENGSVSDGFILIEDTVSSHWITVAVNEIGEFVFDLPDGNYVVTQYWSETVGDVSLQSHFSIVDGLLMVNETATDQLIITLPPVTVDGAIVDEKGNAINGGKIGILDINDGEAYSRNWVIDGNGQFSLRLQDGDYKITAINHEEYGTIPMPISFSVQNGVLMVDDAVQERLNLHLPESNFKGQLLHLEEPLGDSYMYMSSEILQDYFYSYPIITDGNGNFSERLGDGKYSILGIDTPLQYVEYYKEFEVVDGLTSIDFTTLDISEGNVQGQVQDSDGTAYVLGGFLDIEDQNGNWYESVVMDNGEFSMQLPDGNYTIIGLWSPDTGYIDLEVHYSVQNGELVYPLVVTLPSQY